MNARDIGIAQMMQVNGMSEDEVEALVAEAMDVWHRRNQIDWRFEVSPTLAERFPIVPEVLAE